VWDLCAEEVSRRFPDLTNEQLVMALEFLASVRYPLKEPFIEELSLYLAEDYCDTVEIPPKPGEEEQQQKGETVATADELEVASEALTPLVPDDTSSRKRPFPREELPSLLWTYDAPLLGRLVTCLATLPTPVGTPELIAALADVIEAGDHRLLRRWTTMQVCQAIDLMACRSEGGDWGGDVSFGALRVLTRYLASKAVESADQLGTLGEALAHVSRGVDSRLLAHSSISRASPSQLWQIPPLQLPSVLLALTLHAPLPSVDHAQHAGIQWPWRDTFVRCMEVALQYLHTAFTKSGGFSEQIALPEPLMTPTLVAGFTWKIDADLLQEEGENGGGGGEGDGGQLAIGDGSQMVSSLSTAIERQMMNFSRDDFRHPQQREPPLTAAHSSCGGETVTLLRGLDGTMTDAITDTDDLPQSPPSFAQVKAMHLGDFKSNAPHQRSGPDAWTTDSPIHGVPVQGGTALVRSDACRSDWAEDKMVLRRSTAIGFGRRILVALQALRHLVPLVRAEGDGSADRLPTADGSNVVALLPLRCLVEMRDVILLSTKGFPWLEDPNSDLRGQVLLDAVSRDPQLADRLRRLLRVYSNRYDHDNVVEGIDDTLVHHLLTTASPADSIPLLGDDTDGHDGTGDASATDGKREKGGRIGEKEKMRRRTKPPPRSVAYRDQTVHRRFPSNMHRQVASALEHSVNWASSAKYAQLMRDQHGQGNEDGRAVLQRMHLKWEVDVDPGPFSVDLLMIAKEEEQQQS